MELIKCSNCSRVKMGYYPKRQSVQAKMSPYRFCGPRCQQAHWRKRQREARLRVMPPLYCRCGNPVPRELRPGSPRRYCSTSCRQSAANQRRPPSPATAELEVKVRKAEMVAQAAWAARSEADAKATSVRRKADEAKEKRYWQEHSKSQYAPISTYGVASPRRNPETAAQAEVDRVLEMVDQVYVLVSRSGAGEESVYDEFLKLLDAARADSLGAIEIEARDAEIARKRPLAEAQSAQLDVDRARQELSIAKSRLNKRALQARQRRARSAGVEPEAQDVQDVHQVDVDRARQDPDYAAWLRRQGLL